MIFYYRKTDSKREPVSKTTKHNNRLDAAKYFAQLKNLSLKDFLRLFTVERVK
jgi:hypothetical protein